MQGDNGLDGRRRVVIESVSPEVDCGRFPVKRAVGERVVVEADAFADGHDRIACVLRYAPEGASAYAETPMAPLGNDRWRGAFTVDAPGRYRYTLAARIDRFGSWRHDFRRREDPADVAGALEHGAGLVEAAAEHGIELANRPLWLPVPLEDLSTRLARE